MTGIRCHLHAALGIDCGAGRDDIRTAFRNLARRHHPDMNSDPTTVERFVRIKTAYEILTAGTPRGCGGYRPSQRAKAPGRRHDVGGGRGRQRRAGGARAPRTLLNRSGRVRLTLEDACSGGLYRITGQSPTPSGSHLVRIPPGVVDGQVIRLPGRGRRTSDGLRDDLYLKVRLAPHSVFRLVGRELRADLPVAPWEAALGARVPIETPAGRLNVRIPAGCASGRRLRLRGRGLPNPSGDPGDLVLTVRIRIPAGSSGTDRAFFESMS
jgi:curved DNA-binding protein